MQDILAALRSDFEPALAELLDFLRIPSVSADPERAGDVRRCAGWLAERLARDGFDATVEETGGHPAVTARWLGAPGAPTVLVYGHYDVQPAQMSDGWSSDPFLPVLAEGRIRCRGASDDKGQLYCHVAGARAHLRARGKLPVNLIFLFEGEEEAGSENLDRFLRANAERLACDAVVVSDSSMYAPGIPALTYGLRGLAYLEVTVRGANRDLHSGVFGGAAPNPANALAGLLARLHDEAGRVDVPGFYDDVRPLEGWEREMWAALGHEEVALAAELGSAALPGEAGYTALERMWARPTLDVNGLTAGYQGEGAKTVIPATASAKFSCRLVPDQEPARIADLVEARLRELLPQGFAMEVKRLHGARPVSLPTKGWAADAARAASAAAWGREPVLIREGGSIPVVDTFASLLGAPVVLLGLGRPDDRAHGPDERYHLEDFRKGMEISARLWGEMGNRFEIKR